MIVVFDKLGPVLHAEIDLGKRLIVFAGPNHSGKTHVAWTVYGLLQALRLGSVRKSAGAVSLAADLLAAGDAGVPVERLAAVAIDHVGEGVREFVIALPSYFVADKALFASTGVELSLDSQDIKAINHGRAISVIVSQSQVKFDGISEFDEPVLRLQTRYEGLDGARAAQSEGMEDVGIDQAKVAADRVPQAVAPMLTWFSSYELFGSGPAIFPAERTAVSLFSRELSSSRFGLVDEVLKASGDPQQAVRLLNRSARRYPGPILDCIEVANDLVARARETTVYSDLALELERILGGRVDLSAEGEIGFTLAEPGRPRVPFHVSASVVKSLASLVFYFRHQAQEGATLVIDEPELNLHPDLQRKVTRFLAKAVNAGFRIILTTHSDYVLREFSNLVRLGAAGERGQEVAAKLGYDPESTLKPDLVGVWHFANGEAESLEINGDGFNLPSIEDVIGRQNMDTQQIEMAVGE